MKKLFSSFSTSKIIFILFGMLILFYLGGWEYLLTIVTICAVIYFVLFFNKNFVKNNKNNITMICSLSFYGFYLKILDGNLTLAILVTVLIIIALRIILNTIIVSDEVKELKEGSLTENIGRNLSKTILAITNLDFKSISKSSIIYFILFIGMTVFLGGFSKDKNSVASDCKGVGSENCIEKVRASFTSTGKTILGEQYLGSGRFGISFMDNQHPGAYNATVSTDCKCNITNSNVSTIR